MTQVIDEDGVITPVTVLKADENVVVQVKTKDVDGYNAIQVGTVDKKEKNVKKPIKGHYDKAGVSYKRYLREINLGDEETELKAGCYQKMELRKRSSKPRFKISQSSRCKSCSF